MVKSKKAVVLLSGGLDSATVMAVARSQGYEVYALSFDYGQRHINELDRAKKVAGSMNAKKHLVINADLTGIGGSALTTDIEVPKKSRRTSNVERRTSEIPVTYVPARNTIFLSFALGWAEVLEAEAIFIGANAVDYSGYPDCRPEFIKAFEDMANLATKISVEGKIKFKVHVPLIELTKAEIIKKGTELGVDYSLTWSCYDPVKEEGGGYIPCGRCDSCIFRAKGFEKAGIEDPLVK
jgi:7-cyano-7-deazaguanine synthase